MYISNCYGISFICWKKQPLQKVLAVFVVENMFELHEQKLHRGKPKFIWFAFGFFIVLQVFYEFSGAITRFSSHRQGKKREI